MIEFYRKSYTWRKKLEHREYYVTLETKRVPQSYQKEVNALLFGIFVLATKHKLCSIQNCSN
jgi:hypothetical protein